MKSFFKFVAFIVLIAFLSCQNYGTEKDIAAIDKIVSTFYNVESSPNIRCALLSESYKKEYLQRIDEAIYMPYSKLKNKTLQDQLNVIFLRHHILHESLNKFDNLKFDETWVKLNPRFGYSFSKFDVSQLKFESKVRAIRVDSTLYKSQNFIFEKENELWKINPEINPFTLNPQNEKNAQKLIKSYGSIKEVVEDMIFSF